MATLLCLPSLGCGPVEDTTEPIGEAVQAVSNGTEDVYDVYDATVWIPEWGCSGTLITPRWVLTAEHCVESSGTITVRFGPQARVGTGQLATGSTLWDGSAPRVFVPGDGERSTDMALIRLSAAVGGAVAQPLPPPVDAGVCGSEPLARIVGHSSAPGDFPASFYCPNTTLIRKFGVQTEYERLDNDDGTATFETIFEGFEPFVCDWYDGSGNGDSGGTLVNSAGRLCGVISGGNELPFTTPAGVFWTMSNISAAADSVEAIGYITQNVVDADGCFEGECCEELNALNDPDGDGVPTRCDSCPHVATTFPLKEPDEDGDGVGDTCDLCPGVDLSVQTTNSNLEAELALFYEQQGVEYSHLPPVFRDDGLYVGGSLARSWEFEGDKDFALSEYLLRVLPDACDPFPTPSAEIGSGVLADAFFDDQVPIDCPHYIGGCGWSVENRLLVRVRPTFAVEPSADATVGLRWCNCPGVDTGSREGRAQCANDPNRTCAIGDLLDYTMDGGSWRRIHTTETSFAEPSDFGKEWVLDADGELLAGSDPVGQSIFFDFLELEEFIQTSGRAERVQGVLWANVREVNADLNQFVMREVSSGYSDGSASASFGPRGRRWVVVSEDIFCRECPMQVTDIVSSLINPVFATVRPEGTRELFDFDFHPDTVSYFEAVAGGQLAQVTASEPLTLQEQLGAPGVPLIRAVALDGDGISRLLLASDMQALPFAQDYRVTLPPDTGPLSVVEAGPGAQFTTARTALSATRRRVYVVADDAGWILDLLQGTWRSVPFALEDRTQNVVAAGYRHADQAVYFLESSRAGVVLRRWNAQRSFAQGGAVQTLAELPNGWRCDERCWITFDERGDLLLSLAAPGGGANGNRYVLARFGFDLEAPVYQGRVHGGGRLISRPKLAEDLAAVTYTAGVHVRQRAHALEDFKASGVQPTMP